jgi:hypothetical protein
MQLFHLRHEEVLALNRPVDHLVERRRYRRSVFHSGIAARKLWLCGRRRRRSLGKQRGSPDGQGENNRSRHRAGGFYMSHFP